MWWDSPFLIFLLCFLIFFLKILHFTTFRLFYPLSFSSSLYPLLFHPTPLLKTIRIVFLKRFLTNNTFMFITQSSDTPQANSVRSCTRPSKVRGVSLPQEYELARLIQNVETQHPSWSTATPACQWHRVKCNQEKKVSEISWSHSSLSGELHLSCLPLSTTLFSVADNKLTGSVDLTHLPEVMHRLNLSRNRFSGHPDLTRLPHKMEELEGDALRTLHPSPARSLRVSFLPSPALSFSCFLLPGAMRHGGLP